MPTVTPGKDRREVFADWLTRPDNVFFAKSVVNRIWFHLLGKGIVDPVDDFRDSNPSANDELLDALAKDFIAEQFDVKKIIRTIMNVADLPAQCSAERPQQGRQQVFLARGDQVDDGRAIAGCDLRRDRSAGEIPGLPLGTRAIQLPDGEVNHPFLKTFGQPARELACECERESDSNLAQALQLINGPTINEKVRNPSNRLGQLLAAKKSENEILIRALPGDALAVAAAGGSQRALGHVHKGAGQAQGLGRRGVGVAEHA